MKTTNIYVYNNGHILLLQRSLTDVNGGVWETVGGHIDWENFVESNLNPNRYFNFILDEAERELYEESGIFGRRKSVFSPVQMYPEHCSFFLKLKSKSDCNLSSEHRAYMWTRFDMLPPNTRPEVVHFLSNCAGLLI